MSENINQFMVYFDADIIHK